MANHADIGKTVGDIEILRALYEVKNLILSTGAHFEAEIRTYLLMRTTLWILGGLDRTFLQSLT